jgi:LPS export ABC transporter protein LptC
MLSWQKRARIAALVVAVGVVAVVIATTRRREEPPPRPPVTRLDPAAAVESSGAFLVQLKGERETVTIRANKQLAYPDGSNRLLGVTVTSVRQGKTFVATGEEARVADNQTNLEMKGNVRMKASDGLEVTAESATYSQSEGIVRAPGPVTFKRGRMSGSGVDFSYDENRDLIGLSTDTKVKIGPDKSDKKNAAATDITAGSAVLARQDKFVSFERAVHIVHGSQVINAETALGNLTEDQEHLSGLELQGNARIETPEARPGELKLMTGGIINLTYYENTEVLQSAIVTDGASLRIAGDQGAPEKVLHAQNVETGMAPDGTTLTSLTARDQVVLDLPATKEEPAKSVRANSLVASGEAGKGLTAAMFTEGVEYVETTGTTPPTKRTVTSRSLETTLDGGLGEIREAEFTGTVRLRQTGGGVAANADIMRYQVQTGQVELTGVPDGEMPRVVNDQIAVDAARVDMTIEGSKMKATGAKAPVRTVMYPAKPGAKDARRTPGIMQQDRPVNGSSRELVYTGGENSTAEFTGAVRLWQGDKAETVIQGEKITVEGKTGNLTAQGSVLSTMMVQDTNPTTNVRESTRSTGQAQQMIYEEAARTITYTTKARLVGPHGDLTAETIILTLGSNSQDVERLEATENVTLKEADRVTNGDRLTYVASKSEYNMEGKTRLVRMRKTTAEGGCRLSEGRLLTFSRANDHLFIEGREQTRTQTSSDNTCTPPKS